MKVKHYLLAWWRLSRIPFLTVGILPLILGFVLAWRWGYKGPFGLYFFSSIAAVLIMWMSYYLGEWNDLEGDRLNQNFNSFSGGSRVLVEGIMPARAPLFLGYICLMGAIVIGIYIYLQYRTEPWTLLLGGMGIVSGYFYSGKPFRWSYHGLGEILIGFCYGWLPIATGFYLFTGFFSHQLFLLSIPVGLSIFNVIIINEFPDEEADRAIGKRNLVVKFGKERMSDFYIGLSVLAGLSSFKVLWTFGKIPFWLLFMAGIPLVLILWNFTQIWEVGNLNAKRIKRLCRNTLFINLLITMILIIQQAIMIYEDFK